MIMQEQIFEYIKSLSKETFELHRKYVVKYIISQYGGELANSKIQSSVRTQVDAVLKQLCYLGFLKRKSKWRLNNKTLRGYYHFLKEIPSQLTRKEFYEDYKRKNNRAQISRINKS